MKPKTYSYKLGHSFYSFGYLLLVMAIGAILLGLSYLLKGIGNCLEDCSLLELGSSILHFVYYAVLGPLICIGLTFLNVDLKTDNAGITIPYLFGTITIGWDNIIDIEATKFLGLWKTGNASLVIIKKGYQSSLLFIVWFTVARAKQHFSFFHIFRDTTNLFKL